MKDIKFVDIDKFNEIVNDEGLYYAVFDYVSHETIIDPKLEFLVKQAQNAMTAIKQHIKY